MDATPLLLSDTEPPALPLRASRSRGMKLGTAALVLSLCPAAWEVAFQLFARQHPEVNSPFAIVLLLAFLPTLATIPVCVTFAVLGIRKNRPLGKVFSVIAVVVCALTIAMMIYLTASTAAFYGRA